MVQAQWSLPDTDRAVRDLLEALLEAETEADVHEYLAQAGMLDDSHWQPYGGVQNNSGTFFNQQASPRGALVEKIVNSIDAVLMAKAFEHADLPNGSPPDSMFKAADRYFDIRDGRLSEVPAGERRSIARETVQVVLSGNRSPGRPTITIADQGEGQNPESFPDTFLSLSATNKMRIPFVQGKFNMGSAGAVPFCGVQQNYQLILSRRHPAIPDSNGRWGFTVVRRRPPRPDERASQFEYLAPGGAVPSIGGDTVPLWKNGDGSTLDVEHGSLVRLYEYDIHERTAANFDFSRMLNRRLYRLPLPIQVIETRGFRRANNEEVVPGLATRLDEDTSSDVEHGFPVSDRIRVDGVGWVRVSLIPFREDVNISHWVTASESVIFTVNGQAHAFEARDFLRRDTRSGANYRYLAQSLLVEVDCSELGSIEQLFMGSRDRMRDGEQRTALLRALAGYLRRHKGLRELNHKRREAAIQRSVKSNVKTSEMFEKMIAASPTIAALLSGGAIPAVVPPVPPPPDVPYEGQRFPTFLKWAKGGPVREKHCHLGSYCLLELETDASNDFLSRSIEPGILDVAPSGWSVSEKLWDGSLQIRLEPPAGVESGDEIPLKVTLMCDAPPEVPDVLEVEGRLVVDPPVKSPPPPPPPPPRPKVAPPEILEVRRDAWSAHDFDEYSIARVDKANGKTIVFVNMDSQGLVGYVRSERQRRSELEEMYKLAVAPTAISLERAVEDEEITSAQADKALAAVGAVLLPAVDFAAKVAQEAE